MSNEIKTIILINSMPSETLPYFASDSSGWQRSSSHCTIGVSFEVFPCNNSGILLETS